MKSFETETIATGLPVSMLQPVSKVHYVLSVSMCVLSVSMCVLSVSIISVSMVSVSMVSVTYTLHIGYISVTYRLHIKVSVTYQDANIGYIYKGEIAEGFPCGFFVFSREFGFNVRFRFQTGT